MIVPDKMEGITVNAYKSVKGYWKRKGYKKLDGKRFGRRKMPVIELGGGGPNPGAGNPPKQRRRFWRMKKLKLRLRFSPKKLLIGLRDAYVNFMNRLAGSRYINSSGIATGYYVGGGGGGPGFGVRPLKEYDERMIIQIYKSLLVAQSQFVNPAAAAAVAGGGPAARIGPPPPLATIAEC
ncbi:OLC1v1003686C1 [Oldenlandia corymbosa var. corymbosa]|uniref:OLC1v1003686C1 n=1 Tax=Oldenlandia corymbosa var. corymbosa TaxID=529605 RepID=A0AAV1DBV7_OLDCO|nr:OLC1v1003686C1 [Oldenlandia corymbosa var. corymbosa]